MTYLLQDILRFLPGGSSLETDRICHCFMNQAFLRNGEESDRGWEALERVFTRVDEGIGKILEMTSEEDYLVIMSDHGFEARPWNVHINQWLVDEGLLKVKGRIGEAGTDAAQYREAHEAVGLDAASLPHVPQQAEGDGARR